MWCACSCAERSWRLSSSGTTMCTHPQVLWNRAQNNRSGVIWIAISKDNGFLWYVLSLYFHPRIICKNPLHKYVEENSIVKRTYRKPYHLLLMTDNLSLKQQYSIILRIMLGQLQLRLKYSCERNFNIISIAQKTFEVSTNFKYFNIFYGEIWRCFW